MTSLSEWQTQNEKQTNKQHKLNNYLQSSLAWCFRWRSKYAHYNCLNSCMHRKTISHLSVSKGQKKRYFNKFVHNQMCIWALSLVVIRLQFHFIRIWNVAAYVSTWFHVLSRVLMYCIQMHEMHLQMLHWPFEWKRFLSSHHSNQYKQML